MKIFSNDMYNPYNKSCIYKIYFNSFEKHCYIGSTTSKDGLSSRLANHRTYFWKVFNGISVNQSIKDFSDIISQKEFEKLEEKDLKTYLEKLEKRWTLFMEKFNLDNLIPGDSKYSKMIYFMRLHNLSLLDLRVEILEEITIEDKQKIIEKEHKLIEQYNCYTYGFNAPLMSEYNFKGPVDPTNISSLEKQKQIIKENKEDEFTLWNCWWNLYQTFKFSLKDCPWIWLKNNLDKSILHNFKKVIQFLSQKEINFNTLNNQIKNEINIKEIVDQIKEYKDNPSIWFENNMRSFLADIKNGILINKNIYNFFEKDIYKVIEFFKSNPFSNTKNAVSRTEYKINLFLNSVDNLKKWFNLVKYLEQLNYQNLISTNKYDLINYFILLEPINKYLF